VKGAIAVRITGAGLRGNHVHDVTIQRARAELPRRGIVFRVN